MARKKLRKVLAWTLAATIAVVRSQGGTVNGQSYDQSIFVYSIQPLSVFWTALLLLQDPALQTQALTSTVFVSVSIYGIVILVQA